LKLKHWLIFIVLGAIWSSSFMWIKIAVQEISPTMLVAFRATFGLLFGVVVIFVQRAQWPRSIKSWFPLLLLGISNVAIPFFLISWGEKSIDSAVASVLDATVPLFTILIAHYLLHDDKITWPKLVGLLIGFAGVVVLMSKELLHASTNSLLGQAAVILASVFYAVNSVYIRKTTEDIPSIVRSAGPLISASAVMWLATFLFDRPVTMPNLGITWVALLWLGILGSGLAFAMAYYLIHEIGPTRTTMVTYLFPLGGVILGVTFLNEQLTWQLITGAVLIILSLVVANWEPKKQGVPKRQQVASSSTD
jgi:drug/metabolite transporter (DMT)-like permease